MNVNFPKPENVSKPAREPDRTKDGGVPLYGDALSDLELKSAIADYAEWAVDEFEPLNDIELNDVSIEVSHKLKRAAGKAGAKRTSEGVTDLKMRFAWKAYEKWGWSDNWTGTILHELIHIDQYQKTGDGNHGAGFKRVANEIGAPIHCPQFAEYKYELYCTGCDSFIDGRYKRSKIVKEAERYRSKCCDASLRAEEAGRRSRYEAAEDLLDRT